jgi:hypothetical protein
VQRLTLLSDYDPQRIYPLARDAGNPSQPIDFAGQAAAADAVRERKKQMQDEAARKAYAADV